MSKIKTDLYLRDLDREMQNEFLKEWNKKNRKDLLVAFNEGNDIVIGHYLPDGEEKIA